MFERIHRSFVSVRGPSLKAGIRDGVVRLKCGQEGPILKLTFFIESKSNPDFQIKKTLVERALDEIFEDNPPPFSVVSQPPETGSPLAVHAEILPAEAKDARVLYKRCDGLPYAVVRRGALREVVGAGISGRSGTRGTEGQGASAFRRMERILRREGLNLGHIVRQWNYIEDLLHLRSTPSGKRQNYQIFNDIRQRFYSRFRFPAGFPAATGIGMKHGGVVLEFQALAPAKAFHSVPLSNPLQTDAHRYSQDVLVGDPDKSGRPKASPLFERAKFVGRGPERIIFISGTAAVREQATAAAEDVSAQTRITIENIRRLISAENLKAHGIKGDGNGRPLAYLRAYVKRRRDIPAVKRICRKDFGDIPAHFVAADVCREDLLVELEGVAGLGPESGTAGKTPKAGGLR